jgi:hypothetical protein
MLTVSSTLVTTFTIFFDIKELGMFPHCALCYGHENKSRFIEISYCVMLLIVSDSVCCGAEIEYLYKLDECQFQ